MQAEGKSELAHERDTPLLDRAWQCDKRRLERRHHIRSPIELRRIARLRVETDGHAALVHAGDAAVHRPSRPCADKSPGSPQSGASPEEVLLAQLGGEKRMALAARLRMPIRLHMQLKMTPALRCSPQKRRIS